MNRQFSNLVKQQQRGMATLKEISLRLKSVENIGKITKSMKMIASTKVTKAQKAMEQARLYGAAAVGLVSFTEATQAPMKSPLLITCSSDRGLCGGIHSSVSKVTKKLAKQIPDAKIAVLGVKARSKLAHDSASKFAVSFDGVCKFTASWYESAIIADSILGLKLPVDGMQIIYNRFTSVIAFETENWKIPALKTLIDSPKLAAYEIEDDVMENYHQFLFGNALYCALAEGFASEVCSRRTAMENATKNAQEMVKKLKLTYNRSRQAVITNDLCDIITGASALE